MPEKKKGKLKKKKLKVKKVARKVGKKVPKKVEEKGPSEPKEGKQKMQLDEIKKEILEDEKRAKKEIKKGATRAEEKKEAPEEKKEEVTLNYRALSKILKHGMRFSNPNIPKGKWVECMGFLIGDVMDSKVKINDAIPIVHGNLVEVEFQGEHYAKADEINQSLTDENWIVGWYHTHPGHGLFLSPVDKINHSGYQSLNPKAVALVFDPSKFHDSGRLEKYMKIFRLKNPELGEDSDFTEIEDLKIKSSIEDIIASVHETLALISKDDPLVLEYKEDYQKPDSPISGKVESLEKDVQEIGRVLQSLHKELKLIDKKLEGQVKSTKKDIDRLKKRHGEQARKETVSCDFCGYDSVMPGDTVCASCGMKL